MKRIKQLIHDKMVSETIIENLTDQLYWLLYVSEGTLWARLFDRRQTERMTLENIEFEINHLTKNNRRPLWAG